MPKYVDENGLRRVWQTAENTFLKPDVADETYLRQEDAESTYLRTSDAENTYTKASDVSENYLRKDDAEQTFLRADDAERTYLKTADAGAISEENYTTAEKEKLAGLSNYQLPTASNQVLGGVKVGEGLDIDANGMISVTPQDPNVDWGNVSNQPTTLGGYGITDAATKDDISQIENRIEGFYIYRGKVQTLEDLNTIQNPKNGDTYDVEDSGVNYAWNETEGRWDSMGGMGNVASLSEHELDILLHIATTKEVLLAILEEGGMITLDDDITITDPVTLTKNTIIDLSNCTLTSTSTGFAFVANGVSLVIRGGTINVSNSFAKAINGGTITVESGSYTAGRVGLEADGVDSSVTINGGTVSAFNGAAIASNGGHVIINGGNISCTNGTAVCASGADGLYTNIIDMNGGEIIADTTEEGYASCGVYLNNKDRFTMTGGRITSKNGCGLLIRDGRAIIRDGIIVAEGTGSGWVGGNGTKMSHSAIIFHESAKDTHYGMRLEVYKGLFEGTNLALETISENAYPNIYIKGGTFVPSI